MKRILLFVNVLLFALVAFVGCHKDPIEFGNVGVLNINLQRGYKTMNKGAVESFDARVTIYYSEKDTISYNSRFVDTDGDGRYTNDPSVLDNIYVRREVGFWVGVQAVIQGDTVTGMTDPTNLLYLSEENPLLDVNIVLVAGYPRIVVSTNTEVVGEDILIFGEVLEGGEMLEEYGFAIRRGQLGDDEKRLWASRVLTERDMENLYSYGDYQFYDAEMFDDGTNRFGCALEMMDFDSMEYSVAAIAWLREGVDSLMAFVHSPVVTMTISGGAIIEEEPSYSPPTGYKDGYGYVDLGLPSGLLWAYSNVGANTPEGYGDYFAWGETEAKEIYELTTYRYFNESGLTKYCNVESYGQDGYTDTLTTLESTDDAATVNWGSSWRMPIQDEMQELIDNCDTIWTEQNGVNGLLFIGPNGNSVFLPSASRRLDSGLAGGAGGYYWSSSLDTFYPVYAWLLFFVSVNYYMYYCSRSYGLTVRPVCVSAQN